MLKLHLSIQSFAWLCGCQHAASWRDLFPKKTVEHLPVLQLVSGFSSLGSCWNSPNPTANFVFHCVAGTIEALPELFSTKLHRAKWRPLREPPGQHEQQPCPTLLSLFSLKSFKHLLGGGIIYYCRYRHTETREPKVHRTHKSIQSKHVQ